MVYRNNTQSFFLFRSEIPSYLSCTLALPDFYGLQENIQIGPCGRQDTLTRQFFEAILLAVRVRQTVTVAAGSNSLLMR